VNAATAARARARVMEPCTPSRQTREFILHEAAMAIAGQPEHVEAWTYIMRFSHPSLCWHGTGKAVRAYIRAVRVCDDIRSDRRTWRTHFPELPGPDPAGAALQFAEQDVREAMAMLLDGRDR
jgi:hypothetical protein